MFSLHQKDFLATSTSVLHASSVHALSILLKPAGCSLFFMLGPAQGAALRHTGTEKNRAPSNLSRYDAPISTCLSDCCWAPSLTQVHASELIDDKGIPGIPVSMHKELAFLMHACKRHAPPHSCSVAAPHEMQAGQRGAGLWVHEGLTTPAGTATMADQDRVGRKR